MKRKFSFSLITLLILSLSFANTYGQEITLDDLKTSSTPAFNIIDVEPKTIVRPTTPRGLATSLVSSINENGLKPDIALSVAPYWLKKTQKITFPEYLRPTGFQGLAQTSSFSIATRQRKIADSVKGTDVGIGFHGQILPGKPSSNSKLLIKKIALENTYSSLLATAKGDATIKSKEDIKKRITETISKIADGNMAFGPIDGWDTNDLLKVFKDGEVKNDLLLLIGSKEMIAGETIDQFISRLQDANLLSPKTPLLLQQSLKSRVGWIFEVAAASSIAFPSNNFDSGVKHNRFGAWGTLTYRWDNQKDEVSFIARKMKSYSDSVSTNNDFGFGYTRSAKDYCISFEGVFRFYEFEYNDKNLSGNAIRRVVRNNTYRIAVNGEYKISDNVSLTATFGKNYNNSFFSSGNLLALLGLNFGLNTKQALPLK